MREAAGTIVGLRILVSVRGNYCWSADVVDVSQEYLSEIIVGLRMWST